MEKILLAYIRDSYKIGDFILTSGKKSDFYIDVKQLLCNPIFLHYLKIVVYDKLYHLYSDTIDSIGGMELGSVPISTVVSEYSASQEYQYNNFIIRKTPKGHGITSQFIFYELPKKPVILIDDVLTTGGSLYKSYNILIANGIDVKGAIAIIDREEPNTQLPPIPVHSLFTKSNIKGN